MLACSLARSALASASVRPISASVRAIAGRRKVTKSVVFSSPLSVTPPSRTVHCIMPALVVRHQPGRSAMARQATRPRFLPLPAGIRSAPTELRLMVMRSACHAEPAATQSSPPPACARANDDQRAGQNHSPSPESSRANANDRLPTDPLGRIESGDGMVEGRDGADVRPQLSVPPPLDYLTQLGTIGLDNEGDRQAVGGPRLGRSDDGHQRSSGSNQACGPLLDVAADHIKHQIDSADVFQGVVLKVDELLRAE